MSVPQPGPAPADTPLRTRRDPRAERGRAAAAGRGAPERAAARPKPVRIADPACWVLAIPDQSEGRLNAHDRDTLGAARNLADAHGGAVVAAVCAASDELGAAGADRVWCLPEDARACAPERRAAAVLGAIRALEPRHVVLPDAPRGGGDLGRQVAAALGEIPATNVVRIDAAQAISRGDGGNSEFAAAPPRIVLIAPEAAEPVTATVHEALPMALPVADAGAPRLVDLGLLPAEPAGVPLAEAELILSAGAGVTDWPAFHALAEALGACEGASRVVCDAAALPRDRQVGASGTLVSARGYIALGISGAPQHLEGIKDCEYVIAVNTDAHAPIMQRADLAIVGDAQAIMSALLRKLGGAAS
jgi:electron transfer flavoprotein alpha subunit